MKPKVTLYTKSNRISKGKVLTEELYPVKRASAAALDLARSAVFRAKLKEIYDYVLPDAQKAITTALERLCSKYGLELHVVDITRENVLQRFVMWLKGIKDFPTLETSRGQRLQTPFSENELERFISQQTI
jgi:hypothetical protein